MLAVNGSGDDRGGTTGERANLNDAPRRKNADQAGEKKIVPRADASRITDIIESDHLVKKIDLAGRGNFAVMT